MADAQQSVSAFGDGSDYLLGLRDAALDGGDVELVPPAELSVAYSPRTAGLDVSYARTLAESETPMPPILVHRATMTVIDGAHRLHAAALRGSGRIPVRFFTGTRQEAALLAVAVNVRHGWPLSQADRAAAVEQVLGLRPHWSDRAVAATCGLSAKKVSQIRAGLSAAVACERRTGLDGRSRPLNAAQARELAGRLLTDDPSASLRVIARRAGLSPATVADVRNRLRQGHDPVPPTLRRSPAARTAARTAARASARAAEPAELPEITSAELLTIFDSLRRDPSLRLSEVGRNLLRMLDACSMVTRDWERINSTLPAHCRGQMSKLMNGYAGLWQLFADELCEGEEPTARRLSRPRSGSPPRAR